MKNSIRMDSNGINKCYVFTYCLVIALGMFQFGYLMSSWGVVEPIFVALNGWESDESKFWNTALTAISMVGAMIGSLSAGFFTKYGKLRMILIINLLIIISVAICMISTQLIWLVAIGRFFWGFCAGSASVYCPKFISELCP